MAATGDPKKMRRPPAGRAAIIHAPAGYEAKAFPGLDGAAGRLTGQFAWIQIFVRTKAELDRYGPWPRKP
jgi:hypothetical protein